MYSEDDLLPLSGLQHLVFCPRQWALIHLEQSWAENRLTAEGRERHSRVDEQAHETRRGVRAVTSLPVQSLELGLSGVCDVVEFPVASAAAPSQEEADWDAIFEASPMGVVGCTGEPVVAGAPVPVEYKRGSPKVKDCDRVQVCAQALCLEEMTGAVILEGAIYYWETRRREVVAMSAELRIQTRALATEMHRLYAGRLTPPAVVTPGCRSCSLRDICLPEQTGGQQSASRYFRRAIEREIGGDSTCENS